MATTLADRIALWTNGWTCGETKTQTVCFDSSYSAAAYSCRYEFRSKSDRFTIDGVDTGTSFRIAVPAATTLPLAPGDYVYVGFVTADSGGAVTAVDGGAVTLKPNPTRVSEAERLLRLVKSRLDGRLSADAFATAMGDVSLGRASIAELERLEGRYQAKVDAEIAAAIGSVTTSNKGRLMIEFTR